jgi:hypothetical protein
MKNTILTEIVERLSQVGFKNITKKYFFTAIDFPDANLRRAWYLGKAREERKQE